MMAKNPVILAVAALCAVALVLAWRRGAADSSGQGGTYEQADYPEIYDPGAASFIDRMTDYTEQLYYEVQNQLTDMPQLPQASSNIAAMLETIAQAEGTAGRGDPYRVCYAYAHTIASFADHPAITGEWRGERLSDSMCAGAGLGPGCVSTAAGKYQIIKPTWLSLKKKLGLPDFSPASQDAAAIELLRQRGALGPLERGDFVGAVKAARKEWASLPGAGYRQGERSLAWLETRFTNAGGIVA